MSDIKLFRHQGGQVTELQGRAAAVEKDLQGLIERQMMAFLDVHFLASEYSTGKTHKGRIDSLGLDENGCPVIVEYKRHSNENVINQGLFYLDWLLDHQAEFRWLVMDKLGKEAADDIEWAGTRLLCIAGDFTKYDQHAVQQINRNIELIRYKHFGADLLMLELVNSVSASNGAGKAIEAGDEPVTKPVQTMKTHEEQLAAASPLLRHLFESLKDFLQSLGDEVQYKDLKLYRAYRRLRNFASVIVVPKQDPKLQVILKLDPTTVALEEGFSRDVSGIGHWGSGNLELTLRSAADLEKAKPLLARSYEEN